LLDNDDVHVARNFCRGLAITSVCAQALATLGHRKDVSHAAESNRLGIFEAPHRIVVLLECCSEKRPPKSVVVPLHNVHLRKKNRMRLILHHRWFDRRVVSERCAVCLRRDDPTRGTHSKNDERHERQNDQGSVFIDAEILGMREKREFVLLFSQQKLRFPHLH